MYELIGTIFNKQDLYKFKEAGATGIILSDDFHGSRACTTFLKDEIVDIVKTCKDIDLKSYILMNRLYFDNQLDKAKEYLKFLCEINVDYIVYNDLSVYVEAKKLNMESKLVYNPDTIITNSFDVNYHLDKNIHGVVLSKEITKEEMLKIGFNSKGLVGIMVHGYLNMFYSKRPLIKNYFEFINKEENNINNSKDLYIIEEHRNGKMPILEYEQGTVIFTEYVQESFKEFNELFNSNIRLFIVDGIFLNSEFVIDALRCYKRLIDLESVDDVISFYYEKYSNLPLSNGYMDKETNLIK